MRHGEAQYVQAKVSLEEAQDLTPKGVEDVIKKAQLLAQRIPYTATVRIWSSPFGRTLQTAAIVYRELLENKHRFAVKKEGLKYSERNVIRVLNRFDEVRNFDLHLFRVFLEGGEIPGHDCVLQKSLTNPHSLSFVEYFNARAWESVAGLPASVRAQMDMIEHPSFTQARLKKMLDRLETICLPQKTHIVLVTHQGLMEGLLADKVQPADFVTVQL